MVRRLLYSSTIVTFMLLAFTVFGGYLIHAVDPYFGFRALTFSDRRMTQDVNISSLNMGADQLRYEIYGWEHPSSGGYFSNKGQKLGSISAPAPFYMGLVDVTDDGQPDIVTYSSIPDFRDQTGVWKLDSSLIPKGQSADEYVTYHDYRGILRRIPETWKAKVIMRIASFLSNSDAWTPLFTILFVVQLEYVIRGRKKIRVKESH